MLLAPIMKERVWGGSRLKERGENSPIGEAWVLSVRPEDDNYVQNGAYEGETLGGVLKKHPEYLGKTAEAKKFPLLIKFIDSAEPLSIQLHPSDGDASGEEGKSEAWYIIEAREDAYIYLGLKEEAEVEALAESIMKGEDTTPCLNKIAVSPGECYYVPSGTPHAIGDGIYLCEIQQNSDTTFRIYDYGRPRELHKESAVLSLKKRAIPAPTQKGVLAQCEYFTSEMTELDGEAVLEALPDRFLSLTVIEGGGSISSAEGSCHFSERASIFLPAGEEKYLLRGKARIIKTSV